MARQSKHAPAKILCTLRQREAAELRAQKLTMQQIADEMGISKPRVHQLLKLWDENFKQENIDRAEQFTLMLLEEANLMRLVWFKRALKDDAPASDALAYTRIADHTANVAGAKATVRVRTELTGKDGGAIETASVNANMDLSKLSIEQLASLAELISAAQSPSTDNG